MKIQEVSFGINSNSAARIALIGDAVMKMDVKLPHIVTTLALMVEFSPHQGSLDMYDVGFHASWEWDEVNRVVMELIQTNQE